MKNTALGQTHTNRACIVYTDELLKKEFTQQSEQSHNTVALDCNWQSSNETKHSN